MWLFTSDGFVSIVADKDDTRGDRLLVRARDKMHITNVFPDAEVFSKQPSDYQWRAWVSREDVADAMMRQVQGLDYTNFKDSIIDDRYHDACLDVWGAMYRAY
jgi:hypothetical protein